MTETSMTRYASKRMEKNEKFLIKNQKHIEIKGLIDDAIEYMQIGTEKGTESFIKSSMNFYLHQILLPTSYALYIQLLTGNISACFRELRFLYESLAKCYFADHNYPKEEFFRERIKLFEEELRRKNIKISPLMDEFGIIIRAKQDLKEKYQQLSNRWIHTKGFAEHVVDITVKESYLPSWCLILPVEFEQIDLSAIDELNKDLSDFRIILRKSIDLYQNESRNLS